MWFIREFIKIFVTPWFLSHIASKERGRYSAHSKNTTGKKSTVDQQQADLFQGSGR
jgi:hypothetical protein